MNFQQTLDYLYAKLPMYQRIGAQAFKKDLTNITRLCDALGNPQNNFRSIHIAGTNGKGSTSHILSAIYQMNGYKTGLYTSPHLVDFRERIKVNGQMCSEQFVIDFTEQHQDLIETIQPSFFEITVAMAFLYFKEQQVDVAIIETGLGGRLDSTNIITPLLSVITSIGFDHTDMLGDTLSKIAFEKAGIIKHGKPVVVGSLPEEAEAVINERCATMDAPLYHYNSVEYRTDLNGRYQQINIGMATKVVEVLDHMIPTDENKVKEALINVRSISQFFGRWQELSDSPLVLCDVGHNEEGFRYISEGLKRYDRKLHMILGFVKDKDLSKIIPLLPEVHSFYFVKPEVIRGMDAGETARIFSKYDIEGTACSNLSEALDLALDNMNKVEDMLFIGGSNFVVADLLTLQQQAKTPF